MKKIIVILLMLLVFNYADAQKKVVNKIPRSEPEKWLFVGNASTDNMFVMFQDAVMDAMNDFFDYYQHEYQKENDPSRKVEGSCSIDFVKYKVIEDVLYVWLEVRPEGKYTFVTSYDSMISQMFSSDKETNTCDLTRNTTVSLNAGEENMELKFWNNFLATSQGTVDEKKTDTRNMIQMDIAYEKRETYHHER